MTDLFSRAFQPLMRDTVIVQPGAARPVGPFDAFGTFVPSGQTINVRCRCKGGQQQIVKTEDGREVKSTIHFVTDQVYGLTVDMKYTLPSDLTPQSPFPVRVTIARDENGPQHEKVFFE